MRRMDQKLERITAGIHRPADFILADAKDGDMAYGRLAPGPVRGPHRAIESRLKTRADHQQAMREMVRSGLVDIMLMSASNAEALAAEALFDDCPVTPAVRLNDSTDMWALMRGAPYAKRPSYPFRTAVPARARPFADLGLYSVTFVNDLDRDLATLEAYNAFREEASGVGMRHFLEVSNPNVPTGMDGPAQAAFVNDCIVRGLAGVTSADRPLFLTVAYNGGRALEELASYDPAGLVVGVTGSGGGTTRDIFERISQAERHGARAALFGRKIDTVENPVALVHLLRHVVERDVTPAEAVRIYHDGLSRAGIRPDRPFDGDMEVTEAALLGN